MVLLVVYIILEKVNIYKYTQGASFVCVCVCVFKKGVATHDRGL